MSGELIVGPDATNATELLYDVIGDDQLFDILADLAQRDPRANIWDDTDVQARLAELGIQTPQSTEAEPADVAQDTAPGQQGVAEGSGPKEKQKTPYRDINSAEYRAAADKQKQRMAKDKAAEPGKKMLAKQGVAEGSVNDYFKRRKDEEDRIAGTKAPAKRTPKQTDYEKKRKEQGVAEGTELDAILRHAGVPVKESRIHENSEYTYEIVAKVLAREKPGMATDKSNDDFYSAVYHELIAIGMTPKAARNLISYDEDFISDVATAYNHYQDRPGLDENNSEMVMPEADNISTFEVMSGFDAPVAEGSCNMTTEGEYCPEHGLAECAMEEGWKGELAGGTAGGVAGTLAGTAIGGPVGGLIGGAMGGTSGAMIGRELTKESGKDPMDHRGAVTDSFYESEIARMKKLALGK
jgi:hypothetical protein